MVTFVFVVFCIAVVAFFIGWFLGIEDLGIPGFIATLVLCVLYGITGMFHAGDLGRVAYADEYLANKDRRIASLKEMVTTIGGQDFDAALMNGDQPISALTKALADAEKDRDELAHNLILAKRSIASRKVGLFGAVTWVMPEKVEAE